MAAAQLVPCGVKTYPWYEGKRQIGTRTIQNYIIRAPGHPADKASVAVFLGDDPQQEFERTLLAFEAAPTRAYLKTGCPDCGRGVRVLPVAFKCAAGCGWELWRREAA